MKTYNVWYSESGWGWRITCPVTAFGFASECEACSVLVGMGAAAP